MLKSTGILRHVDNLGRVVIPRELRRLINVEDGNDYMEIFVDDDNAIVLKKYQPSCIFCNSMDNVVVYKEKQVCKECINKLVNLKEITPDEEE